MARRRSTHRRARSLEKVRLSPEEEVEHKFCEALRITRYMYGKRIDGVDKLFEAADDDNSGAAPGTTGVRAWILTYRFVCPHFRALCLHCVLGTSVL